MAERKGPMPSALGKDAACAAEFEVFASCVNRNRNLIGVCQAAFDDYAQCHDAARGEAEPSSGGESLREPGLVSQLAIAIAPQVFDDDAPRKKTVLAETLEKYAPHIFKEDEEDD